MQENVDKVQYGSDETKTHRKIFHVLGQKTKDKTGRLEDDFGHVEHIKNGSTILLDKGYHPSVVALGYEMYYFTILVGKTSKSLVQHFEDQNAYQLKTIQGIMDMVNEFK